MDKHYIGVRLSLSLSDWVDLGDIYPPARTLLRYVANYAKRTLMSDPKDSFSLVQDYISVNRSLERTDQTISLFKLLDINYSGVAAVYFMIFQDELAKQQEFVLYNKYISPDVNFSQMLSNYTRSIDAHKRGIYGEVERRQEMLEFLTKNFMHNISRFEAILIINIREEEAKNVVAKAKLELDSDEFMTLLNNA